MESVAVITAQPNFPGMDYWNPIEEAITLVHEIAHSFGAIHVTHENTLMYPTTGTLAYKFDKVNKYIFESMSKNYFAEDKTQRTQQYINTLIEMNKDSYRNNLPVLSVIYEIIYEDNYSEVAMSSTTEELNKHIKNMIQDSSYALAVMGVSEFNLNNWDQSIELLSEAVKLNPGLAEANWYLGKAYDKVGKGNEADKYKKIAKPFSNNWIVDNKLFY